MSEIPRRRHRIIKPGSRFRRRAVEATPGSQQATSSRLIQLFTDARILQRAKTGELTTLIEKDEHPAAPLANEPVCTRSQYLVYYGPEGNIVAEAHRYLRPDGSIGLSGKPDPKVVKDAGTTYYLDIG
jgi:hypothetical protein